MRFWQFVCDGGQFRKRGGGDNIYVSKNINKPGTDYLFTKGCSGSELLGFSDSERQAFL